MAQNPKTTLKTNQKKTAKQNPKPTGAVVDEIQRLREKIRHHEYLYHVVDDPEISDAAFDKLLNKLKQLEKENPKLITPNTPTQRVGGAPREGFQHARPKPPLGRPT